MVTHNSKISDRVLVKIHYKSLYDLKFNYNFSKVKNCNFKLHYNFNYKLYLYNSLKLKLYIVLACFLHVYATFPSDCGLSIVTLITEFLMCPVFTSVCHILVLMTQRALDLVCGRPLECFKTFTLVQRLSLQNGT